MTRHAKRLLHGCPVKGGGLVLAFFSCAVWIMWGADRLPPPPPKTSVVQSVAVESGKRRNAYAQVLQRSGIEPNAAGVRKYLQRYRPTPERYRQLAELVQQLGAPRFQQRRQAEKQLAEWALLAKPAVETAARSDDPETSRRAKRLLEVYENDDCQLVLRAVFETVSFLEMEGVLSTLLDYRSICRGQLSESALRRAIAAIARPADKDLLQELAESEHVGDRVTAVKALGEILEPQNRDELYPFLKDPAPKVRFQVALCLARLPDPECLPTLISLLTSEDAFLRSQSFLVLRRITGESFDYQVHATKMQRQAAMDRWRDWLEEQDGQPELRPWKQLRQRSHLNGNTLLAYGYKNRVEELDPSGKVLFTFNIEGAWSAEKLASGNILIASNNEHRVVEVTMAGEVVWEYKAWGLAAKPLRNGNVLIVDYRAKEVLEVEKATNKTIWRYATPKSCTDAQRLANGNTLIAAGNSVIEIDRKGTIVWQWRGGNQIYGIQRLLGGNTLIADIGRDLVVEINPAGEIIWALKEKNPCDVFRLPNGNTLITARKRFIEVAPDKTVIWSHGGCSYGSARR